MQTNSPSPAHSAEAAPQHRAKRRAAPHAALRADPATRPSEDGRTVSVALSGTYGEGRWMVLDAFTWGAISAEHGDRWGWNWDGARSHGRVVCGSSRLAHAARQGGPRPTAVLARIITGARRGHVVVYRNGSPLDLRRANLAVLSPAEAARHRAALLQARA